MRLTALEQKLLPLVQGRWGPRANIEVCLDAGSTIVIDLPDGTELRVEVSSSGMLPQAYAELARHLERLDQLEVQPGAQDNLNRGASM